MPRPTGAARIFHGRGGLHPGCEPWTLDAWPPVWVLTCFRAPAADPAEDEAELAAIGAALAARGPRSRRASRWTGSSSAATRDAARRA